MARYTFKAEYFDGKTAASRRVSVDVEDARLVLSGPRGAAVATWPIDETQVVDTEFTRGHMRLGLKSSPDERLVIDDADAVAWLDQNLDGRLRRTRLLPPARTLAVWTGLSAAAVLLIYFGFPLLAEPAAKLLPKKWEQTVGDRTVELIARVTSRRGFCRDRKGIAELDRLVGRLTGGGKLRHPIKIRIINSDMVNAFAAPGGNLVLFTGLIRKAESPEEVAGVIAHELGHIVENHPSEALIRDLGMNILIQIAMGGSNLGGYGETFLQLSFTREAETEADKVAHNMLARANIPTEGLADFFERLAKNSGGLEEQLRYLSTHPPSGERADAARKARGGTGQAMSKAAWGHLKTMCSTPKPGTKPKTKPKPDPGKQDKSEPDNRLET